MLRWISADKKLLRSLRSRIASLNGHRYVKNFFYKQTSNRLKLLISLFALAALSSSAGLFGDVNGVEALLSSSD
jgi:hypothetical protein